MANIRAEVSEQKLSQTPITAFSAADEIERLLGKTGIDVLTRLLGMLLAALSVQFVIEGIIDFFPN